MAEVTLENAPRKAKELFDKGFAAYERGNLDYAMDMLQAALDIEPRLLKARKFLRAAELTKIKDNMPGEIAHIISTVVGIGGILGVMSQIKKKPLQALKAAEKLLRTDPLNMTFIKLLGQAATACEMPEVAIQTLEIAREHHPKNLELMKWLGKLYLDNNQSQEAHQIYEDLLEIRPNDPELIKILKDVSAIATMRKGGWEEAGSYRDVMKDTKEAVQLEREAKAVKSGTDLDSLIAETETKVRREPENINYRRSLADFYARANRFEDSLRTLTEARESLGRNDPQLERAVSETRVRQYDHDIAQLRTGGRTAEADTKESEKNAFLLADSEDRVKRYPNDLQFRYEYGVLLFDRHRLNEAIQEFQLAQRNPQRRIRALYYLAMCFKQKNQYDIAIEQLEKASSEVNIIDENKKDILYEMGTIYELMGQPAKAAEYYKEIYSVDISYKDIAEKIEKAYKK